MAIELHHLHPSHDDEMTRLKARIAELEKENQTLAEDVSDKIESITELMELVEKYKSEKGELEEAQRWRKVSEELPTDGEAVAVCFHTKDGRLVTSVDCLFDEEWQMMDDPEGYWMPLPKAPKEEQ